MEKDPMEVAMSTDVILESVMKYLHVIDLLSCRKVCMVWNKQASFVLRKRSTMIETIPNEDELMKLEECMKQSWDFPFAGLKFDHPWRLNSRGAMEFFKTYGDRFTRLCLDTKWEIRLTYLAPFINHLPRLSILEADCMDNFLSGMGSDAPQEGGEVLILPSVRTFRISTMVNEDVLDEVLAALSPSVQIECRGVIPENLIHLKNAGRLRAISSITICGDVGLGRDYFLSSELPWLTKLYFRYYDGLSLDLLKAILSASQKTLKNLHLVGTLADLSWESYVFVKLTKLSLSVVMGDSHRCLFQGEHGDKFPVLKKLKLRVGNAFDANWSDGLFIVPSVTKMELNGCVSENGMKQLAQALPNVLEVLINHFYSYDVSSLCKIWSVQEFKNLEKLKIWNYMVKRPTSDDYINMDSLLTGMPVGICNNLRKHEKVNLANSPFNEILRESPNILQLKNLRELIVCVMPEVGFEWLPEYTPFMSIVSVWYALEMMPNLQAKFVYYDGDRSLLSGNKRDDKRDNALLIRHYSSHGRQLIVLIGIFSFGLTVLEAAFEDVKEYIKLEPFFY